MSLYCACKSPKSKPVPCNIGGPLGDCIWPADLPQGFVWVNQCERRWLINAKITGTITAMQVVCNVNHVK